MARKPEKPPPKITALIDRLKVLQERFDDIARRLANLKTKKRR